MGEKKEMDLVCGMWIVIGPDTLSESFEGKPYYFCEEGCRVKFKRSPTQYMKGFEGRKD